MKIATFNINNINHNNLINVNNNIGNSRLRANSNNGGNSRSISRSQTPITDPESDDDEAYLTTNKRRSQSAKTFR